MKEYILKNRSVLPVFLFLCMPLALKAYPAAGPKVICGADRLFTEYFHCIEGKKLALVANHSAVLRNGTHLADALYAHPGVQLRVLFGMEFNIRSNDYSLERDPEKAVDSLTGLFKYSLYGQTHKPTDEMLGDVEAILFDIQSVGVRFYEHANVLGFVMEAAAEKNIEVIVLDRPNPLGGVKADGFVTDDEFLFRFGSYAKIPVCYGMTMGELAMLYNGEGFIRGGKKAKLQVIGMKGWERGMWFDETGLPWKKPSPNLTSFSAVPAYAGTCLFEGINISEGRGTDKPFEYIGAPWLDHRRVIDILQKLGMKGVEFEPVIFIPEKKSFAKKPPELSGEVCKGIYIHVTDRDQFEPYRAGIALLWAIHQLHADKMIWNEKKIEHLSGTRRLINMIRSGKQPHEIYASWDKEVKEFLVQRKKYLIYK